MISVQQGSSSVVYVPAGWQLNASGLGIVQVVPPAPEFVGENAESIRSPFSTVGPFSVDVSVYVAAYGSTVVCDVVRSESGQQETDEFETLLSRYGAVLNGFADDSAAIQNAINEYASDGRYKMATFPPGLTANIATPVGTLVSDSSFVGISIPANLSVDWNGCQLFSNANWGAGDSLVTITDSVGALDPYGQNRTVHKRGRWTANSNFDQVMLLGNDNPAIGPSRVAFEYMLMENAANIITLSSNSYLAYWQHCEFRGWASAGYAITSFGGSTNWGENFRWQHCTFYNAAGTVLRARGGFYVFDACSMDYVKQAVLCDNPLLCQVELNSCHLEQNQNDVKYGATQYMLEITSAATASQIRMNGGRLIIAPGGTGNNLDGIAFANGSNVAPNGIILERVIRQLSGVPINAVGAGRFVDNS